MVGYPVSLSQKSLQFINRLTPESTAYDVLAAYYLSVNVNDLQIEKAINGVVARHPILTVKLTNIDGKECQISNQFKAVKPIVVELSDQEWKEPHAWLKPQNFLPFDINNDQLFQLYIYRHEKLPPLILFRSHHIVCEYWSISIVAREFQLLLQSMLDDSPSELPIVPGYFKFIEWQNQFLSSSESIPSFNYWYNKLSKSSYTINLPYDFKHPVAPSLKGGVVSFDLTSDEQVKLKQFGKDNNLTLYTVLLASFFVLLYRYTQQSQILIGAPALGRPNSEFRKSVGYFVNTVVVKGDLEPGMSFLEFAKAIGDDVNESLAHQNIPFSAVVDRLNPKRDSGHSPVYQVLFDLISPERFGRIIERTVPSKKGIGTSLKLEPLLIRQQEGQFDLVLQAIEFNDRITCLFKYNGDVFNRETIEHISANYKFLLGSILASPEEKISVIPLVCEDERNIITRKYQPTRQSIKPIVLPEWFQRSVERFGDRPALQYLDHSISYLQLAQWANSVAARVMREIGSSHSPIAIRLPPSLEMVVAILGVLKSGNFYLPIDESLPVQRAVKVIKDAKPKAIISQKDLDPVLTLADIKWIWMDDISMGDEDDTGCNQQIPPVIKGSDPAYVMYTSGSTGDPKGVIITHANVSHLLSHLLNRVELDGRYVWTLFHSISFDYSIWEIWGALSTGSKIVIVPKEVAKDFKVFYQMIAKERVSVLSLTPGAFYQFDRVEALDFEKCGNSLRMVFLSGDRLDVERLGNWFARHNDNAPNIYNLYGITETTVFSTIRRIEHKDIERDSSPIGAPFDDSAIYLLDKNGAEVPVCATGEIHIAGDSLAKGYLHSPELTRSRFLVGSPRDPDERLYRTGDLAKFTASGELEYMGRNDRQVKIRGYRIELAEIELIAEKNQAVDRLAVDVKIKDNNEPQLVAYLRLKEGHDLDEQDLRTFLEIHLPTHMIPAIYICVDDIPLTANWKIDYSKLPHPGSTHQTVESSEFNDEIEKLRNIWSRMLGETVVDLDLDFFNAGGDSLSIMRLEVEIEEQFGKSISLSSLINESTIRKQSILINSAKSIRDGERPDTKDNPGILVRFISNVLATLITIFHRLMSLTVRTIELNKPEINAPANGIKQPTIFAHWHGEGFMFLYPWRNQGINLLVSKSDIGQLASVIVRKYGYEIVHGSSSSDGFLGLTKLASAIMSGKSVALAVDGSRGPYHRVKPGVVELARQSQVNIQPVSSICSNAWVVNQSWDKAIIPKPFSKVYIKYGTLISPPASDEYSYGDTFKWTVELVEKALKDLNQDLSNHLSRTW